MIKNYLLSALAVAAVFNVSAQEASYDHPQGLRYLGTISNPDPQPVCSFTTRNPVNDGAFLWAPVGATVKYTDTSSGVPLGWIWETDGGTLQNADRQDAFVTYREPGTYDFPSLTVEYDDFESVYDPDYKIKIGGMAELCLADTRSWIETYALGVNYYDQVQGAQLGSLGGTNALNIVGVGNLYMMSVEDGFLDGVNVYLPHKPTRYKEGAKVGVRIWMANISQYDVQLAAIPIEGDLIPFEDIKDAEDGAWVPIKGGAVVQMKCSEPIDLFGKPFIFIDVYGWSDDPASEDFAMLMDVMPNVQMQPEYAQDMLAHNSFVRLQGEDAYLRPVSYFGGNYGSFMICPMVRGAETPPLSGVGALKVAEGDGLSCRRAGASLLIQGADADFRMVSLSGATVAAGHIANGRAVVDVDALPHGVYVVSTARGESAKINL